MIFNLNPSQPAGTDNLAYWENFLTEHDITKILSLPEWLSAARAEVGRNNAGAVDDNVRRSNVSWMEVDERTIDIWNKISSAVTEVNRTWFHYDLTGFYEPAQLTIYKESDLGYYKWHTDSSVGDRGVPRKLSMSLLLSDPSEFEGGELQVMTDSDNPVTLEQKQGRAWFFPSFVLHRVTPVTKGIRRSLVLWIGGPGFK